MGKPEEIIFPDQVKELEKRLKENPKEYFRCEQCGSIYKKETPENEMIAEYKENFPDDPEMQIPRAIICDDCYKEIYEETDGFNESPFEKDLEKLTESFAEKYYKQWSIDEK